MITVINIVGQCSHNITTTSAPVVLPHELRDEPPVHPTPLLVLPTIAKLVFPARRQWSCPTGVG